MPSVLVVDDERDILDLIGGLLKKRGYEAEKAKDGFEAIRKLGEKKPDAVLLDIMMPGMTGWEVLKKIKSNPETKDLPVIMLTVLDDEKDRLKSFKAGADWHISSPFDTDHLFFILDVATKKEVGSDVMDEIEEAVERDRKMNKISKMINPKLIQRDYEFLG